MEEVFETNDAVNELDDVIPKAPPMEDEQPACACSAEMLENFQNEISAIHQELTETRAEMKALSDYFSRRLANDRQKNEMIQTITDGANYAFIEPFLYDLILLLDRIEDEKDEMVRGIYEELMEILERRDVRQIKVTREFNSKLNKAVRVKESDEVTAMQVIQVVKNGYIHANRVVRPAEVVVAKPKKAVPPENA